MPTLSKSTAHHRARVAALARSRDATDQDLAGARRDLRVANLEEHIARVVEAAPPLLPEQREHLAALLRTSGGETGG